MFKDFLEKLKTQLEQQCPDASVELFLREINQYKYISQKPVLVIQFRGADLENPPHPSVLEQKAEVQVYFYYYSRTLDNAYTEGVFEVFEAIRKDENITVQSVKTYSHKKNVSVWEIKTKITQLL